MNPITVPTESVTTVSANANIQHLCPFVQEVDNGTINISWETRGWTIELHSLRAYLNTFTKREISHEDLTEEIRAELATHHGIKSVAVNTRWRTAGMEVQCSTSQTLADQPW